MKSNQCTCLKFYKQQDFSVNFKNKNVKKKNNNVVKFCNSNYKLSI